MSTTRIDLSRGSDNWETLLAQLEAEQRQTLGIGSTLRDLAGLDL